MYYFKTKRIGENKLAFLLNFIKKLYLLKNTYHKHSCFCLILFYKYTRIRLFILLTIASSWTISFTNRILIAKIFQLLFFIIWKFIYVKIVFFIIMKFKSYTIFVSQKLNLVQILSVLKIVNNFDYHIIYFSHSLHFRHFLAQKNGARQF